MRMHGFGDHPVFRNDRIRIGRLHRAEKKTVPVDHIQCHHDESDAALGPLGEVRRLLLGRHAVVREARQVRRNHHAIPELDVANLERAEKMLELFHYVRSSHAMWLTSGPLARAIPTASRPPRFARSGGRT